MRTYRVKELIVISLPENGLTPRLARTHWAIIPAALFSGLVNLLMLTGPLFMLQIFDRVLTSHSVPTLIALTFLVAVLYVFLGLFDLLRMRLLSRVGFWLEGELNDPSFTRFVSRSLVHDASSCRPLADLRTVRAWITSAGPLALFDLPFAPLFIFVVALFHPWLGMLTAVGALVLVLLALANEVMTRHVLSEATTQGAQEGQFANEAVRTADVVLSMGVLPHATRRWRQLYARAATAAQHGIERGACFAAVSKAFRLLLQSAILALGAWLAIHEELSAGMIVAASITAGRALAPIDQIIGGWRGIQHAWSAWGRLCAYLRDASAQTPEEFVKLPQPTGVLEVHSATKFLQTIGTGTSTGSPVLANVTFRLEPGDGLGIIGPSASGKSTLLKMLVGLWMPDRGEVRLDGATYAQWSPDQLSQYIGYLPQQVGFLSGTIAENIARFDPDALHEDIVAAAQLTDVHDLILTLPEGYATQLHTGECSLSGGQMQRIALARAMYGRPCLVVLDEPNANLDAHGDAALANAIKHLRDSGCTIVVSAHRPSALAVLDSVLMLSNGRQVAFGPKHAVLRETTRGVHPILEQRLGEQGSAS